MTNAVHDLRVRRVWVMPNKYTFKMPAVSALLVEQMEGEWADPFSGCYSPATIRNDADESRDADFHLDGLEFLKSLRSDSLDGVLFDPPYSTEQALRKYKPVQRGTAGRAEYWAKCKDEIARIVRPGGKAICFAWDSTGVGKKRGFRLNEVLLLCHGACHNDTIVTVEQKVQGGPSQDRPESTVNVAEGGAVAYLLGFDPTTLQGSCNSLEYPENQD